VLLCLLSLGHFLGEIGRLGFRGCCLGVTSIIAQRGGMKNAGLKEKAEEMGDGGLTSEKTVKMEK
jgi:hypothetical protein